MSETEDTPGLFWGLMLQQKTIDFVYLEKKLKSMWVKTGKMLRHSSTEALGTTPVISPKSDF